MERDVAGTKAKVEMLEKHLNKVEERIEAKQDGLAKEFVELKTVVVTAIATAKVKWAILFRVAALVGVVAAIVAAIVKYVMMK